MALPTEYFGTPSIPHLVVQVGKDGRVFLINADDMGGYLQGPDESNAVVQTLGPFDGVWGHPAAWGGQGGWVYILESAGGGSLAAYGSTLGPHGEPQLVPEGQSAESFEYASGSPIVTSDGTTAGSAVVWVVYEGENGKHAQLRAYGAIPEGGTLPLLWSAPIGTASKFSVPTASEGRVYVGTRNGKLLAFAASGQSPVQAAPVEFGTVAVGHSKTVQLSLAAARALRLTGPIGADGVEPLTPRGRARQNARPARADGRPDEDPGQRLPLSAGVLAHRPAAPRRPSRRRPAAGSERVLQAGPPRADRGPAGSAHQRRHEDGPGQRLRQRPRADPLGAPARLRGHRHPHRRQGPGVQDQQLVDRTGDDHRRAAAGRAVRSHRRTRGREGARTPPDGDDLGPLQPLRGGQLCAPDADREQPRGRHGDAQRQGRQRPPPALPRAPEAQLRSGAGGLEPHAALHDPRRRQRAAHRHPRDRPPANPSRPSKRYRRVSRSGPKKPSTRRSPSSPRPPVPRSAATSSPATTGAATRSSSWWARASSGRRRNSAAEATPPVASGRRVLGHVLLGEPFRCPAQPRFDDQLAQLIARGTSSRRTRMLGWPSKWEVVK